MFKNTRDLVRIAMLVALSVIFNIATINFSVNNSNAVSFTYIPAFIAGIYFGPIAGGLVGLVGDYLGAIIAPKGAYLIWLGVGSMLTGVIPGLMFMIKRLKPSYKINSSILIIISFILCFIICTAFVNTYAIWSVYIKSMGFFQYMLVRAPLQIFNIVLNTAIMLTLYNTKVLDIIFHDKFIKSTKYMRVCDNCGKEMTGSSCKNCNSSDSAV